MDITSNFLQLFQFTQALGWTNGIEVFARVKLNRTQQIRLKGIRHPFRLRSNSSDISVFRQVFILEEYKFEFDGVPRFIVDGGSNVGMAAIYFANRYPEATVVGIEPESGNFHLLQENAAPYGAIVPVRSGIWSSSTNLRVTDPGLGHWGFMVEEENHSGNDTFAAISITDIMNRFNASEISILKLDVEGAEKEIFSKNYEDWLPKTRVLVVELHDRMKEGCSKAFFRAMSEFDFSVEQLGENLICRMGKRSSARPFGA